MSDRLERQDEVEIAATAAQVAATNASQPVDSDLTAISDLTTTSFGRGLLALANQGALLTAAGAAAETHAHAGEDITSGTIADARIPSGIARDTEVAAAIAGISSGSITLLHTVTLGASGAFDQSGISQAYNDLILVLIARSTRSAFSDDIQVRFNNDSGAAKYANENGWALSNTPQSGQTGATSGLRTGGGGLPAASSPANSFGVWQATIFGYTSTAWLKSATWHGFNYADPGSGSQLALYGGGVWLDTSAINRIQIQGVNVANVVTGSQLRIYGRL